MADAFQLTDSTTYTQSNLTLHSSKDISNIHLSGISQSAIEKVDLNTSIHTFADGISMKWQPSYFILNQKKWTINPNGILVLRKSNTSAANFKLTQGLQEFIFSFISIGFSSAAGHLALGSASSSGTLLLGHQIRGHT